MITTKQTGWLAAAALATAYAGVARAAIDDDDGSDVRSLQGTNSTVIQTKCVKRWGYRASPQLQACVAMGIADYCGACLTNTNDGTPFAMYDPVIHRARPGFDYWTRTPEKGTPPLWFEAAWVYDGKGRKKQCARALCLSKKRWATLPMNGPCPDILPDPRTKQDGRFCEDVSKVSVDALDVDDPTALDALRRAGALLFDKSSIVDAGLRLWTDGTKYYSSTFGFDGGPVRPGDTASPLPGVTMRPVGVGGTRDALIGVVFTKWMRWFLDHRTSRTLAGSRLLSIGSGSLLPLVAYNTPTGPLVTTETLGAPRLRPDREIEGYVFKDEASIRAALPHLTHAFAGTPRKLIRYKNATGQFATSTHPPAATGWTAVRVEGYVLRGR